MKHLLLVAAVVGAGLMAAAGAGLASAGSQDEPPEALEDAIARYVALHGDEYAGPCRKTELPGDVGKWCSEIRVQEHDRAEAALGRAFGEYSAVLFLEKAGGEWSVTAERPIFPVRSTQPANASTPLAMTAGSGAESLDPGDTVSTAPWPLFGITLAGALIVIVAWRKNGVER